MATFERARGSRQDTQITDALDELSASLPLIPALTILAHPDPGRVGDRALLPELKTQRTIHLGRNEPTLAKIGATSSSDGEVARPLEVFHLSRHPLVLRGGPDPGEVSVERGGSPTPVLIDGESLEQVRVLSVEALALGVVLVLGHRVVLLLHLDSPPMKEFPSYGLVGESLPMRRLREEIRVAALLEVPVLLRGESGTGKELVARAIHEAGPRHRQPYVPVNMAAVPASLASAELFGASRGAFTGADKEKPGYFQRAAGGTIFLDEIGDTPSDVQPLLLRVLESGEIQPLGGGRMERVDVRIIAATDADLDTLIEEGAFRKPLLHRLAGYEIHLPPLRSRRSDLGRLLFHFLRSELENLGAAELLEEPFEGRPWPPAALVARLASAPWSGNVRQLRNVARRMAISRATGTVLPLGAELLGGATERPPQVVETGRDEVATDLPTDPPPGWRRAYRKPSEVGDEELLRALAESRYQLKATAKALGISRASLYSLIDQHPKVRKANDLELDEVKSVLTQTLGDLSKAAAVLEVSERALRRRVKTLGLDHSIRK